MIIYFSGGKDSLAVLHMFKDDPDLECVYFGDTGDIYPHMMKFVIDTCKKFNVPLEIIKAKMSQEKYHAEFGYPSDMVPVVRSPDAKSTMQERSLGKVVYRGIKKCDEHGTDVENGYTNPVSGIQYINPIYNWTDDMVFEYLKKNNVELARHYKQINVSMDCVHCTAFTHSPTTVDRLRWTKENYPSYWPEIQNRFKKVKEAIDAEAKIIDEPFDFVLNNRG